MNINMRSIQSLASKIPNINVPVINVHTNPLDVLLAVLGLRMMQLAHTSDDFAKLIEGKDFIFQIETQDGEARHFIIHDGKVKQKSGKADKADFTLRFKDAESAFSTLIKGDPTAFMTGMQAGEIQMEGDFGLLMWFNQASKQIVALPPALQSAIRRVKNLMKKVKRDKQHKA